MTISERYQAAKRTTIVNAITNVGLAGVKIVIGWLSHSQVLLADGIHSLSDLITDALVLVAAKIGGHVPDKEHPYGHQRIETIAAMIIAILLWGVGAFILYDSYLTFVHPSTTNIYSLPVIIVAVISMLSKEWLYRYTLAAGKKINSNLLISNAFHNRSDVFVSGLVLIAIVGHLLGIKYADQIGAAIIAIIIIKSGVQLFLQGIKELIDTGVNPETLNNIKKCIESVPGVESIHQLRTRLHGGNIFVDTHLIVNPFISVSEGHHIGEKVHAELLKNFNQIIDVVVHIDPENDEVNKPSLHLPTRAELINTLQDRWRHLRGFKKIESIRINYLNGEIYIELYWSVQAIPESQWTSVKTTYLNTMSSIPYLVSLNLFLRL